MIAADGNDRFKDALAMATALLSTAQHTGSKPLWLVGGSCGLMLQGVPLTRAPQDIDVYAELEDTERMHACLGAYTLRPPADDYSRGCYSRMGYYRIGEMPLELVGGFQITSGNSLYALNLRLLAPHAVTVPAGQGQASILLMPLAHELLFNVLRGKEDRCRDISQAIRGEPERHMPLLQALLRANAIDSVHRSSLEAYTQQAL